MKNIFQVFILFAFSTILTMAQAETFKETFIEFQKFKSKISVGTTYPRYIEELANIEYATRSYEMNADDRNQENVLKFKAALRSYKLAGDAWGLYLNAKRNGVPESFSKVSNNYCSAVAYYSIGQIDNFDECISAVWKYAEKLVDSTQEVKAIRENKTSKEKSKSN
jgi:hypothetical protein